MNNPNALKNDQQGLCVYSRLHVHAFILVLIFIFFFKLYIGRVISIISIVGILVILTQTLEKGSCSRSNSGKEIITRVTALVILFYINSQKNISEREKKEFSLFFVELIWKFDIHVLNFLQLSTENFKKK